MNKLKKTILSVCAAATLAAGGSASAAVIAVFGDNGIDNYLSSIGHTVSLVSDAQLATSGFLNPFDLFVYTRDGASFGTSLSAAAAENVSSFVTGSVVLFASDLADVTPGDLIAETLFSNAVNFSDNKGYIGEFTGSCAAMTSNSAGLTPLGLIPGSCSSLSFDPGDPQVNLQPAHPVLAGVPPVWGTPGGTEFYAFTVVDPSLVLTLGTQNQLPTVIARDGQVPEPATAMLLGLGLAGMAALRGRRKTSE